MSTIDDLTNMSDILSGDLFLSRRSGIDYKMLGSVLNSHILTLATTLLAYDTIVSKSSDYTILDDDGYRIIAVTTGAIDKTITLPTLADNANRPIKIMKVDSGAGSVIVDGEGAETINECTTIKLAKQYDYIEIVAGSIWYILAEKISCQLKLDTYAGFGLTDTRIMRFTNSRESYGNCFSENHSTGYNSNNEGLEITINKPGKYAFSFTANSSGADSELGLSLNSSQLTIIILSINVQDRLAGTDMAAGGLTENVFWEGYLNANDVIRAHGSGNPPAVTAQVHFTATYLG